MLNIATRMMLSGKNVAYITLEMAEDECANRIDSYLTNLDVNKLYDIQKTDFLKSIKRVASNKSSYGELYIKQYPTSMASCNDIRSYLYELQMRGVNIDVLFVDYLNILGSTKGNTDSLYIDIKRTGEELRALTYPFNLAC
jgi:replicative DNA helicase